MSIERRVKKLEEKTAPKDSKALLQVVDKAEDADPDGASFILVGVDLSGYPPQADAEDNGGDSYVIKR